MSGMSIIQQILRKNQEDEYRMQDFAQRDKEGKEARQHEFDKLFTQEALGEDKETRATATTKELAKFEKELNLSYADKEATAAALKATLAHYAALGIPPEQAASIYEETKKAHLAELAQKTQEANTGQEGSRQKNEIQKATFPKELSRLVTEASTQEGEAKIKHDQLNSPDFQNTRTAAFRSAYLKPIAELGNLTKHEVSPGSLVRRQASTDPYVALFNPPMTGVGGMSGETTVIKNFGGMQFPETQRTFTPGKLNFGSEEFKVNPEDLFPNGVSTQPTPKTPQPRISELQRPSAVQGTNLEENLMNQLGLDKNVISSLLQSSPEQEELKKRRLQEENFQKNRLRNLITNPHNTRNY
jgi:hypothetical protein